MGLFSSNRGYLGIDIGTFGVKMVELKKEGGKAKLFSYGFSENKNIGKIENKNNDPDYMAGIINKIWKDSGMVSRSAIASLPTFSVFSSILNLSNVAQKDMKSAVHWEAKKVIPLPLDEMILDWKIIKDDNAKKGDIKVFLTGAPRVLIKKYIEIFKKAQINLLSLETETFSLIRVLLGNDKSTVVLVEIGANTTDIAIVENGIPVLSRSVDVGGLTITKAISGNLNIGIERAEQFKYDLGVGSFESETSIIPKTIADTIQPIVNEIKHSLNMFQGKSDKQIDKVIFSGGSALLVDFTNYLSKIIDKQVIIGNPWSRISYPTELKLTLDEIGPRMSVAVGLAMRD
ncbi:MAG TPA: type IV pilus assembly protein PilM, partial [Candidatus Wolfebacteria bacterium]|nr:type IV pilus assembly protein PilM [Candidatus Wolfebacteria bacterium]